MTDPTPSPPELDRISHNHGPEDGGGMACREHRTGDCIIRELTARAEAAEAKIAAVRASVLPYYEADGHACDDLDEYCARCVADEAMDALDGTA